MVLLVISTFYAGLMSFFLVGWFRAVRCNSGETPSAGRHASHPFPALSLSVVVAARNESGVIADLLDALRAQDYPTDRFEVLVVDDYSGDDTFRKVKAYIDQYRLSGFRLVSCNERGAVPGKKHALDLGIRDARGEYILSTDADCRPPAGWLTAVARCIAETGAVMVLGPVALSEPKDAATGNRAAGLFRRIFSGMQMLEFMSLMGVAAGAAGAGHPLMANGASLAFSKRKYVEVNGYDGNSGYVSGDDMFLLHKFKRLASSGIVFLKNPAAIVETTVSASVQAFFRQRGRWAGKAGGYRDAFTLFAGGVVAVMNLMLAAVTLLMVFDCLFGPVAGSISIDNVWGFASTSLAVHLLIAWAVKGVCDFLLLFTTTGHFGRRKLLWYFPLVFPLYPFYVVVALVTGVVRRNKW